VGGVRLRVRGLTQKGGKKKLLFFYFLLPPPRGRGGGGYVVCTFRIAIRAASAEGSGSRREAPVEEERSWRTPAEASTELVTWPE